MVEAAGVEAAGRRVAAGSLPVTIAAALALLLAWQAVAGFVFSGHGAIPAPWQLVDQVRRDGPALYWDAALATLRAAAWGWLWGNALAIGLALLIVLVPPIEGAAMQVGVASYCVPLVAVGPILLIVFAGDTPRVVLAALSVLLTTLVGALAGLRSADRTMLDMMHAFGGNPVQTLVKVRVRAALPSLFAALCIAAPAAVLGAIVAEYMGAETGLGVVMINAQQALETARTWDLAITATLLAGAGYGLTSLVARWLLPWARDMRPEIDPGAGAARRVAGRPAVRALRTVAGAMVSLAVVLLLWWGILLALDISPFIGKTPVDVWRYLAVGDLAAEHRGLVLGELAISLRDAALGLVTGTAAAIATALLFTLSPTARRAFMGAALFLRSVPLVAMTPLIVLLFGRGLLAIAVIGAMITFFPTLVNLILALDRTPRESAEVLFVLGASRLQTLWAVQAPHALPSLFASLRVAAPLAITGAMLAEWLATGQGLGYAIMTSIGTADYDGLWARVALLTAASALLYTAVAAAERRLLARLGGG
jgi:sulfonate transport system permease protein